MSSLCDNGVVRLCQGLQHRAACLHSSSLEPPAQAAQSSDACRHVPTAATSLRQPGTGCTLALALSGKSLLVF